MSQSVQILIVGVGSIGERHVRCFQSTGRCQIAICEIDNELRNAIRERYAIARSFSDLDGALRQQSFDAAVVATPAHFHIPQSIQLARRGTHLLIEKPLSVSWEGVDRLAELVADRRLVAAVGYSHRGYALNQAVKQVMDGRRFGAPLQAVFQMGQSFATYRPAYRDIYYADRNQGGGGIQDAMTHLYDLGAWLLGPIDRVVTDAAHQAVPGVEVEDTVHTLARHGNVLASYALNQYQAPNEVTYTIVCERGTLRAAYARRQWSWMTEPDAEWKHERVEGPTHRDAIYIRQAQIFLDAIQQQAEPLCSLHEGIQSLRVNLASLRSFAEQSWQDVR